MYDPSGEVKPDEATTFGSTLHVYFVRAQFKEALE